MFENILFPLDFSRHAERIVHRLPDLKRVGLETVVLLHVINPIKAVRWRNGDEKLLEKLQADAEKRLRDIAEGLATQHGIAAKYRVEIGVTDQEIINTAVELSVSLIVMGAHGRSYIRGTLLGSVTQSVLRQTKMPLLIARFHDPEDKVEENPHFFARDICAKILYPTDFSENALRAFRLLKTCRQEGEKEVILLHVQDTRRLFPYLKDKMVEFDRIDEERLEELKRQLLFVGYSVRSEVKTGIPFVEINKTAEAEDVTLIVLASHGKSNIREALLGSVTEAVAQHHVRPVLVVPRD
ncbi:MAG: universal stress protein [Syntrophales bacterium]|jgi:nucleotide-binding universal stress UspA family protein|nr:universal stress protein [Syntrophales bacterium]